VAVPDVVEAAKDADILVFVVPHQFIRGLCRALDGKIKPTTIAVSLIKVSSSKYCKWGVKLCSVLHLAQN